MTNINKSREQLADVQHEIWSHWMKWVFEICPKHYDDSSGSSVCIPPELVERWTRQINTPYDVLSEKEKDSDRHQADKTLAVVPLQAMKELAEAIAADERYLFDTDLHDNHVDRSRVRTAIANNTAKLIELAADL